MRYISNTCLDPAFNLATEEWLLRQNREDVFMLWRNDRAVIVGRNQNARAEINVAFVQEQGIPVLRRLSGGGAVYHDLGNVNYTFIGTAAKAGMASFQRCATPMLAALQGLGLQCAFTGRNDIEVQGRKISGMAQYRSGDRVLCHGTLLFDTSLETLATVLRPPAAKFTGKSVASVRSRVANIADMLRHRLSVEDFMAALWRSVAGKGGSMSLLDPLEKSAISELAEFRYRCRAWNMEHSPSYGMVHTARTPGGSIEAHLHVCHGRISAVRLFGDYFGSRDVAELEAALCGCPHDYAALITRLSALPVSAYMEGVDAVQLAACLA